MLKTVWRCIITAVRLVAIVKENLDTEIDDFKARAWPEADLFMDESKLMCV